MISLLVSLVIVGIIFYFIEMIPMAAPFPQVIRVVAILIAVLMVLSFLGVNILPINLN